MQYANITKGYRAKYREIGNEIYGNGYYGNGLGDRQPRQQEPGDLRAERIQYASAMKAVDPSIKIGAVVTLPGN